jgi:hypothetical protein
MKLNHPLNKVRPKDHMEILRTVLPDRYSPLQANGNGIQSIYLTELSWDFAEVLSGLIGQEARSLITATEAGLWKVKGLFGGVPELGSGLKLRRFAWCLQRSCRPLQPLLGRRIGRGI